MHAALIVGLKENHFPIISITKVIDASRNSLGPDKRRKTSQLINIDINRLHFNRVATIWIDDLANLD